MRQNVPERLGFFSRSKGMASRTRRRLKRRCGKYCSMSALPVPSHCKRSPTPHPQVRTAPSHFNKYLPVHGYKFNRFPSVVSSSSTAVLSFSHSFNPRLLITCYVPWACMCLPMSLTEKAELFTTQSANTTFLGRNQR